jgi:AraC-like DNA-binding protein
VERSDAATSTDWARLALECGYFDQAHLIHDFASFASVTPAEYRRRQDQVAQAGMHTKRLHLPLAA